MAQNTHTDLTAMRQYFAKIERTERQFEDDLKASGRFQYLGIEGNNRLYKERETGRFVKIWILKTINIPTA
jgi:site-specific DNA-adenine methylase